MAATAPGPMPVPSEKLKRAQVWSPRLVAVMSIVFGYVAGTVLAAINWWRLRDTPRAVEHLVAVAVLGLMATFFTAMYGVTMGLIVHGLLWIVVAAYLDAAMRTAIGNAEYAGIETRDGGWVTALAVAVLSAILMVALMVAFDMLTGGPGVFTCC